MATVNKTLLISLLFFLILVLQESLVLKFGFSNLNLFLIALSLFAFFLKNSDFFTVIISALLILVLFGIFWSPFWLLDFLILVAVTLMAYFLFKKDLVGNEFLDYNILFLFILGLFHLSLSLFGFISLSFNMIMMLFLYNVVVANAFFLFLSRNQK